MRTQRDEVTGITRGHRGRRFALALVLTIVALLLVACGADSNQSVASNNRSGGGANNAAPPALAAATSAASNSAPVAIAQGGATTSGASSTSVAKVAAAPQPVASKVIRNDALSLQVKDVPETITAAGNVATSLGGFVVSSRAQGTESNAFGDVTLRVPAEQYDAATMRLRALGAKVLKEESSSQDVTDQYVDLVARQKNLELTVAQLQALLMQAKTVDETLKVQTQLTMVSGDLESIKGKVQLIDSRVAFSTISLSLELAPAAKTAKAPSSDFGGAIANAWATSLQGLQNFALLLINVLVGGWWAILLLLGLVALAREWRRRFPPKSPALRPTPSPPQTGYPASPAGYALQPIVYPTLPQNPPQKVNIVPLTEDASSSVAVATPPSTDTDRDLPPDRTH